MWFNPSPGPMTLTLTLSHSKVTQNRTNPNPKPNPDPNSGPSSNLVPGARLLPVLDAEPLARHSCDYFQPPAMPLLQGE